MLLQLGVGLVLFYFSTLRELRSYKKHSSMKGEVYTIVDTCIRSDGTRRSSAAQTAVSPSKSQAAAEPSCGKA